MSVLSLLALACNGTAVDLVKDGAAVAEIVIAESAEPSVRTAANELQRNLEKMSGAKLAIVTKVSPDVKNQVYVGYSDNEAVERVQRGLSETEWR